MKNKRSLLRLLALLLAFGLVAAACGDSDDDSGDGETETTEADAGETGDGEETEATEAPEETAPPAPDVEAGATGGTLIWAHEQEPPDLHLDDPNNNLSITS
ncbi:MAG: hypothetical protein AAGF02_19040, partial [Actinomycetota bacterium]